MSVITDPNQVTPAYLTVALQQSGALVSGHVDRVDVEAGDGTWSKIVKLRPQYSSDAQGNLPPALLLKLCAGTFGRSEIDYLTRDYVHIAGAPIPRCYDAQFDQAIPAYHVLMDDLSATHRNGWEREPVLEDALAFAEAVAALHAPYWHAEQRTALGHVEDSAEQFERYLAHTIVGLEPLLEHTQSDIDDKQRAILSTVFKRHPAAVRERIRNPHGLTLIHGDLNPGNILRPIAGARPVFLIDRQPFDWSLTTWLGANDLAYAIVHWWPTGLRQTWEEPVLRRYHAALIEHGIADYPWEHLWNDYRLTAIQSLYVTVEWCVLPEDRTAMRWVWFPQLQKALAAYEDLGCAELL